jgi:hypothetical protein
MKRIPVESASEIVTVDETLSKRELASFSKSIVRLKPSAIAEASDVKIAAEDLRNTALAVKVLPRPPANRLIMAAQAGNIVVRCGEVRAARVPQLALRQGRPVR